MDGDLKGPSSDCEEGHGLGQGAAGVGVRKDLTRSAADGGPVADGDPHVVPLHLLVQG